MKKLLMILFLLPLLIISILFFTNKSFQNTLYFIGWNTHILKINNIQEAISKNPNTLFTLKAQSPPPEHVQNIIKWMQYFQNYYKSISKLDSDITNDLKEIGIQRPARHVASTNNFLKEEYLQKLTHLKDKGNVETTLSLGINKESFKNADFNMNDFQKYLKPDVIYADIFFKIPKIKSLKSVSLLSLTQLDPQLLMDSLLKNMNLEEKQLASLKKILDELHFSNDSISGIPVFVIKHNKLKEFQLYMTLLSKEHVYFSTSKDSFSLFIEALKQKSTPTSTPSTDFFWSQLNLEMVINTLPDKFKFFLPASARNLKSLTIASTLTDKFSLEAKVEFTDNKSPQEALKQLEMLSSFSKKPTQKMNSDFNINTDEWIKKYFSYNTNNNFIISKLEIPLSEPRSKIESFLSQEFKNLSQDKSLVSRVIQYMKTNKLVQIKLKDIENPYSFSQQSNSNIPFLVRQGVFLSTKNEKTNFRPFMLIAQSQCKESAKFSFQLIDKNKTKPASMYKMLQDPSFIKEMFDVDKNIQGLQVFMIKDSQFSSDWSMEFKTENEVQLSAEEALGKPSQFTTTEEPKKIFKLKSESPCQIPFEPILIGQIN